MAFRLVSAGGINVEPTMIEVEASGVIAVGDNVSPKLYGGGYTARQYVSRLGSTTATNSLFGIAQSDLASGTGMVNVILINGAQIWEADTTASTNINQRYKANALSTYAYVANSVASGSVAVTGTGVFYCLREVGATTDKKMLGRFISPLCGD
jgi:glutamine amidotransferase-like uncharacterized protein